MAQLTSTIQTSGGMTVGSMTAGTAAAPQRARRRSMRNERMVSLRSAMPVGLVTLRHDVPKYFNDTMPQVDGPEKAEREKRTDVDTPVRKGGEAQW